MATDARIRELDARHDKLDHLIVEEMKRPSTDTLQIASLKNRSLNLKKRSKRSDDDNNGASC